MPAWVGVVAFAIVVGGLAAYVVGLTMLHKSVSGKRPEQQPLPSSSKGVPAIVPVIGDIPSFCAANLPPASIQVELVTTRVKEDFSAGIRELTASREEYHKNWYTLGLTHGRYAIDVGYTVSTLQVPGTNTFCYRPNIKFTVGLSKHIVQVGQELRQDSCGFAMVLAHEYRHVKVNEAAMQNTRDTLETELRSHYATRILYGSPVAAQNTVVSEINTYWYPRLYQLIDVGMLAHKNVDTPQEYASTSTVCGGEIPRRTREAGVSVQYKPSEM